MSKEITLTIPDELLQNAESWSNLTHRNLNETLTDALKIVLTPIHSDRSMEQQVISLSNEEVLALTKVQMDESQGKRLNKLLEKQQEGTLEAEDHLALMALMQIYNQLWLRQAEALAEAVKRGIHPPMQP
ncbi:MAG: hypothetical protein R2932_38500 [Caldilineaceae bacterium]